MRETILVQEVREHMTGWDLMQDMCHYEGPEGERSRICDNEGEYVSRPLKAEERLERGEKVMKE